MLSFYQAKHFFVNGAGGEEGEEVDEGAGGDEEENVPVLDVLICEGLEVVEGGAHY